MPEQPSEHAVAQRKQSESVLDLGKSPFRILLEKLPAAAYACDAEGLITYYNQQAVRVWGRVPKLNDPVDRFCGSFKLFSPSGAPITHDQCWMALALRTGNEFYGHEIVVEREDGSRVTALAHANPIRDDCQKLVGAVNILVDITERRRDEQALHESEERFRVALKNSPIVVFRQDRDLRYTWVYNPKLGRSEAGCLGKTDDDLLPPEDSGPLTEIKRRVLETGLSSRQEVVVHDQGKPVYYDLTVEPVFDSAGAVVGINCTATDVTENKKLHSQRDRLLERLRLQIERMPLAYVLFDADFRVIDWNPTAERTFGYSKEEALGMEPPFEKFVPESFRSQGEEVRSRIRAGDMLAHSINENLTKDGRTITCQWFNTPLTSEDGGFGGLLCLAQDVTDRKRAEEAQRESANRLQALTRRLVEVQEEERRHLARELHDEIGQVLTAVLYNLEVVKGGSPKTSSPRLDDCIGVVDRAIQQVRDLSLDLRPSILDDSGLRAALEWYTDRLAQRTGLVVNFSAPPDELFLPRDLRTACFRVAQEALTNVVRHAAARQVWLEIKLGEGIVDLAIRDDGKGFDTIAVGKRVARERRIGLEGIRERALLLGGKFILNSAPGKGTAIRVVFPLATLQADEEENPGKRGDAGRE